jgi:imidazolonepropionase-like amidohydrolase
MTHFPLLAAVLLACANSSPAASAPQEGTAPATPQVLFQNVRVWDGTSETLTAATQVLVEGNLIKAIGEVMTADAKATVIDGGGRTLMPGLIDSHVHLTHHVMPGGLTGWEASTWEEIGATTAVAAREYIMSGFTTVRDMGGMGTGFKLVIDRGDLAGPRIYACGAYITQTSGHGDLRLRSQVNTAAGAQLSNLERLRVIRRADGVPEVLRATRENFADGAAYIKLMAGGGVSSAKDPLHTVQFTAAELSAAVESATNWDTYVSVHIYQSEGIRRVLDLGIKCIDHGQFIDDDAMRLLTENDAFLSPNLASFSSEVEKHPIYGDPNGPQYEKAMQFPRARDGFIELVKKHRPKVVFNTDIVLSDLSTARAGRDHSMFLHAEYFGNLEALKAMTSVGGQLAALTGKHNPYPGKLGVIEEGAYADLLLVDGNPLVDITVLGANAKMFGVAPRGESIDSIRFVMKDGRVYKNTLGD